MRKSIIFSLLLFGCLFFVRPSAVSAANENIIFTDDLSLVTVSSSSYSRPVYNTSDIIASSDYVFIMHIPSGDNYPYFLVCGNGSSDIYLRSYENVTYSFYMTSSLVDFHDYSFLTDSSRCYYSRSVNLSSYTVYGPLYIVKMPDNTNIYINGELYNPLPPIELNRELTNNFTISRYRFAGYASTNARYAISTDPAPSSDCDYYWSTTFMGPDLNQVTNMLNEFRHQDSEDLDQWLVNHALDKSYRISNSVTYHHWTNQQMNTFDSRTGLFTIALPNSFIDAYDLSSVPAEDLADVQRIIYFSGYPVLVRMYYENLVTRERSPLTSVEYKPSALAFWDYAGIFDFLPDPDDQGFSYTPGELVYDADLSDVTGVLYDVNYFSGWLANIVNAMPTKPLSLAFMTFIVTIIVGVVGVVLR